MVWVVVRRGRGDLGQQILSILDAADEPLTPAQVHEALGADLAYTTVMTVLSRLHEKGVLSRERTGRTYAYAPLQDPARVTARRMRRILDVEPDRAAALARFIDDLEPGDEQLLRALLTAPPEPQERS